MDWLVGALAQIGTGSTLVAIGIEHLGLFVVAGIVLNLTPGPDVLYIVAQGVKGGARAGCAGALGIVAGCFVHIAAAGLGVSALIATSGAAFTLLKWLGAGYLAYVGWTLLRSKRASFYEAAYAVETKAGGQNSLKSVFVNGFWTNALNPKVALFFLAFVPQFIAPDAPHKTVAFFVLGLVFNLNSLWVNLGYGLLAGTLGAAVAGAQSPRWAGLRSQLHWLERAAGTVFMAFGLKLALMDNPSP